MPNSPISSVRVTIEDRRFLEGHDLSLGEAIKRYVQELRISDEMFLTRGLEEVREKVERLSNMNQTNLKKLSELMTPEEFKHYVGEL